jgi:Peptidase family M28/PDZ domain
MKKNTFLIGFITILCFNLGFSQVRFEQTYLEKHLEYLASDKLKGRGTGTKEELKAAKYIAKQFKKIGLQPKGDAGTYFHHFSFKKSNDPHGFVAPDAPITKSQNVAGFLDNGAPHTIVIGAHYDHLGLGHDHNSLEANPEGKIHNGADDNASGTTGVIALAKYFQNNGIKENSNFLFLCYSGEELGLLGSKKYCETPTIDLKTVNYAINMDMIGRLNPTTKRLVVGGVGTAPNFSTLVDMMPGDIVAVKDSSGIGPSDHTSFYLKDIPVLFFFTGGHSDYHKPTDDADKINYKGMIEVLDYAVGMIQRLDDKGKLTFQATKKKAEDTPSFKVTLGIMPDYAFDGMGVRIDGVTDNRPAAKAGLLKGDVIIQLGDLPVTDMQAYMKGLSNYKKGDETTVKVKRNAEEITAKVIF